MPKVILLLFYCFVYIPRTRLGESKVLLEEQSINFILTESFAGLIYIWSRNACYDAREVPPDKKEETVLRYWGWVWFGGEMGKRCGEANFWLPICYSKNVIKICIITMYKIDSGTLLYNTGRSAMDCSPPGSYFYGILEARILEWITIPFSRGIFPTQGLNSSLLYCRQILYSLRYQGICILMAD